MDNSARRRIYRNASRTARLIDRYNLELEHGGDSSSYNKIYYWMPRDRSVIFVAYTVNDPYCYDPIKDSDGQGRILTKRDDSSFLQYVGRDSNGDAEIEPFLDVIARLKGYDRTGVFSTEEQAAKEMWEEAALQGKIGTPFAVPLEERRGYHGGYREIPWDDDREIDAVWIPDDCLLDHIKEFPKHKQREEAHKCFKSALDEFNKWAEGDCWGVCVDEFRRIAPNEYERTANDACWGYVGSEWAEEAALDEIVGTRKFYLANRVKKEHTHGQETRTNEASGPDGDHDRQSLGAA